MIKKRHLILIAVLILHEYCVLTQDFPKCAIRDSECVKNYYQSVAKELSPTGLPAMGIPVLDPFHMTDVDVPVMDMIILTLVEGDCDGIGNCTVLKYETDLDSFNRTVEILCDRIVIKGIYKIWSDPFFCKLFGGKLHGYGDGSIVLENWYFKFVYPFDFVKRDNGQIYTEAKFDDGDYVSEVWKNFTFKADNIMVDDEDITEVTLDYINRYWCIILKTFAKYFHKISVGYYYENHEKFFNNIPATQIYTDDLTPYLKKNLLCGTKAKE